MSRGTAARLVVAGAAILALAATGGRVDSRPESNVRRLNNLVVELLAVRGPVSARTQEYAFVNPRPGWVFMRASARGTLHLLLDGKDEVIICRGGESAPAEAMRLLAAGEHRLRLRAAPGSILQQLEVRAIPELLYCKFQADPHVRECGPYDWEFLSRDVLPNINTLVGTGAAEHRPRIEAWKREGKRWIIECGVPGLARGASVTADEAEKYWTENPGLRDPLLDGVIADEFFDSDDDKYLAWSEALRRIRDNPALRGKTFYPYCGGSLFHSRRSREFIQLVMDAGWRFAWERYLPEQRTEGEARALLAQSLSQELLAWRQAQPGVEQHMIVCLGYLSAPPESLNINPALNYLVWMDMQFNHLANDPAFRGLYGVMEYLSSYADEEAVRWAGRLYRRYCIEGKRRPLTRDPYLLAHLSNPDFERGLEGWTVHAAAPGSVAVRRMEGYSWLQGRYPETTQGDTFLWLKRSAQRPNVVAQMIRGLQPGRLYSLKLYSADYQDLLQGRSAQQEHALSLRVDDVEALPDKSFRHVFANCYSHHHGPFNDQHRAWMNYHRLVFRARRSGALLTISDWASESAPGGPIGQELMLNFVEVQPYLE